MNPTSNCIESNEIASEFGNYLNKHKHDGNLKDILKFSRQHYVENVDDAVLPAIQDELIRAFYNFLQSRKGGPPDFQTYLKLGDINKVIEYALIYVD